MGNKECCLLCGQLTAELFCRNCLESGQKKIAEIHAFLQRYPGVSMIELCREIPVNLDFVNKLISKGYLNIKLPKAKVSDDEKKQSGFHGKDRTR